MQSRYSQHYHVVGWRLRSFLSENFLISPFCISKKSFSGVKTEGECNQPNQKGRLIWQENLRLSDVICLVVLNFIFGNIFFYFDSAEGKNFEIFIYKHFLTLINKSIFITLLLFIHYLLKTNKKTVIFINIFRGWRVNECNFCPKQNHRLKWRHIRHLGINQNKFEFLNYLTVFY